MRQGPANRRSRSRNNYGGNNNRKSTPNRNQVFDSNGPEVRIRGTAHQVCEKYLAMAKDAGAVGDIVMAENYMQHAEHYQRMINSWNDEIQRVQQQSNNQNDAEESSNNSQNRRNARTERDDSDDDSDDLALPQSLINRKIPETAERELERA